MVQVDLVVRPRTVRTPAARRGSRGTGRRSASPLRDWRAVPVVKATTTWPSAGTVTCNAARRPDRERCRRFRSARPRGRGRRTTDVATAPEELLAIRFKLDARWSESSQQQNVDRPLAPAAGRRADGALARRRRFGRNVFGLDEQLLKRRMGEVGHLRGEDDLGVTGDLDRHGCRAVVHDPELPDLDLIFRADRDLVVASQSRRRSGGTPPCRSRR